MGNKILQDAEALYIAGVKSATFRSDALLSVGFTSLNLQEIISASSGLTGSSKIQVSNDKINWDDYPGSSHSFTGNESFSWIIIAELSPKWLSVLTTITGGSANFELNYTGIRTIT